ncbi:hypothetical protein JFV26_16475 [Pseudomonas sp. TH31]|nr:hypothetical protein [Pseudomonas sp. TH31]
MTLPANRQGLRVVRLAPPIDREFSLVVAARKAPSAAVQTLLGMLADQ